MPDEWRWMNPAFFLEHPNSMKEQASRNKQSIGRNDSMMQNEDEQWNNQRNTRNAICIQTSLASSLFSFSQKFNIFPLYQQFHDLCLLYYNLGQEDAYKANG